MSDQAQLELLEVESGVAAGVAAIEVVRSAMYAWRPPRRLRLSEWADEHFYLSAESAAEPGRWRTLPYQRGIMDAITDPEVERVTLMKSARVGYTKIITATIGFYIHQDPCPIMVVQPTEDDAKGFSKEEIAPMLRDCPALAAIVGEPRAKDRSNTILHKNFPGGTLQFVGANSPRGFRRVSRKVVIFDEVDGYPPSAGVEGDQIKLGIRRSEYYWDRKIIAGSTPTIAGISRIEEMFLAGDQRRYYVPCPQCGHMDYLVFTRTEEGRGHAMKWPEGRPRDAYFECSANGCVIEHQHKRAMIEAGEWRASAPFDRHASFHIWAAYSYSPNATWGDIAEEFVSANRKGTEALKTFVNTVLGETWKEKGEAPEWQRLYDRRESYAIGSVPLGVLLLTAGVDVQKDRLVYEIVGWGYRKESWSIDAGIIPGDTSSEDAEVWRELDALLDRRFVRDDGVDMAIARLGIDTGFNSQVVYSWVRRHTAARVTACKGVASAHVLISPPTAVDVTSRGKRYARGCKVWPVGVNLAKAELYGWLKMQAPEDENELLPSGWCHFPEYGPDYFKQLTAEHLVKRVKKSGAAVYEWEIIPGRENHWLDCRIYARAAAAICGIDRMSPPPASKRVDRADQQVPGEADRALSVSPEAQAAAARPRRESWLTSGRVGPGRGPWIGRRR